MRFVQLNESVPIYFRYAASDNIRPTGNILPVGSVVTVIGAPETVYDERGNKISAVQCNGVCYVLAKDIEKGGVLCQ